MTGGFATGGYHGSPGNDNPEIARWGREGTASLLAIPLGRVRDNEPDYFCLLNAMAVKEATGLTDYQLGIVFNKECESKYPRDVIGYMDGPVVFDTEQAVEFDPSHTAYWWDVSRNTRIPNTQLNHGPSTFRRAGTVYFGQNFSRISPFVYNVHGNNGTQISGKPLPAGSRNNHQAVNIAIEKNQ